MIDRLQQHFGFTKMPFGRDLAPAMLHHHAAHAEAAARITWTITEKALGVITGEVGTGKTVAARAALAATDPTRHTIIYIGNPAADPRAAAATTSSPPSAAGPPTAPPPSPPRPTTSWPARPPNAAAPPC
jgi:type II secretory pathway predicted ATPase ExeA